MAGKKVRRRGFFELVLFILIITFIYLILALFGSTIAGQDGQDLGKYLRDVWGGALLVIFLFGIYLCVAGLWKFRIPKMPRQILGTLQLYLSLAFLLGFLRQSGWQSDLTIFQPGIGEGIAKFFLLNVGTLITLIIIACSFLFSAFLFGSKLLKMTVPDFNSNDEISAKHKSKKQKSSTKDKPREKKPEPENEIKPEEFHKVSIKGYVPDFPDPEFEDDGDNESESYTETEYDALHAFEFNDSEYFADKSNKSDDTPKNLNDDPMNVLDRIIYSIDAGEFTPPEKKSPSEKTQRTRKIRRPLPEIKIVSENAATANSKSEISNDEAIFPPPSEIFGDDNDFNDDDAKSDFRQIEKQGKLITSTLKNFGISATVAKIVHAPQVIQFQIEPAQGTKVARITSIADDLTMTLGSMPVRVEAPIPGTHYAGIEIPNPERKFVSFRRIFDAPEFKDANLKLPVPLGLNINSKIQVVGLEEMPVLFIAGNPGSGLGNYLGVLILSLTSQRKPNELQMILIDPEHVEFAIYDDLPHLITRMLSEPEKILSALKFLVVEAEKRAAKIASERVRTLDAYNRKSSEKMPYIVVIINAPEELLTPDNEILSLITKLSRKARSCGICLILSSRRLSPEILTDAFKAGISGRIAFNLTSASESKLLLDFAGAEKLTGRGDILFKGFENNAYPLRFQTPYLEEEHISDFIEYVISVFGKPELKEL